MRKCLQKQTSTPKKVIKGPTNIATTIEEIKSTIGLIYVPEKYEGSKEECIKFPYTNYDKGNCEHDISVDFKIVLKTRMPLLRL